MASFRSALVLGAALAALAVAPAQPARAAATDCPAGGTVHFAVEPSEAASRLTPAYDALMKLISEKLGCPIDVSIPTSYNAEIEAMRAGKVDFAQFGPLGYVLAHQIAGADAIATFSNGKGAASVYYASIVTWPGSGITKIQDVAGKTFAYSDPASTSGHLFPAFGLRKYGIDPDKGVKALYAGSHTASYEALRNHKVEAGELNSIQVDAAIQANEYNASDYTVLWKSDAIPVDPITVRRDLPAGFKKRLTDIILSTEFSSLSPDVRKVFPDKHSDKFVPFGDEKYNIVRDLVSTLNIDLNKL